MTDTILRLTTLGGHAVILDASKWPIKITLQDGEKVHSFVFDAVRHSDEMGHYLATTSGTSIKISGEDAVRVTGFVNSRPKKKNGCLPFVLGGAGIFIALIFIGSLMPKDPSASNDAKEENAAQNVAPTIGKIGDWITLDKVDFAVTSVAMPSRVGTEYTYETAAEGGVLVVVQTAVKNTSSKPIKAYDLPKIKLIDPAGTEYESDAGKTGAYSIQNPTLNAKLMSDLNPDITTRDAEVFEVSKEKFDPATWYAVTDDGKKIALK